MKKPIKIALISLGSLILLFVIGCVVLFWLAAHALAGGEEINEEFYTWSQEKKNEQFTQAKFKEYIGIEAPAFDVDSMRFTNMGPDCAYWYKVSFKEPLDRKTKSSIDRMCKSSDLWKKESGNYVYHRLDTIGEAEYWATISPTTASVSFSFF